MTVADVEAIVKARLQGNRCGRGGGRRRHDNNKSQPQVYQCHNAEGPDPLTAKDTSGLCQGRKYGSYKGTDTIRFIGVRYQKVIQKHTFALWKPTALPKLINSESAGLSVATESSTSATSIHLTPNFQHTSSIYSTMQTALSSIAASITTSDSNNMCKRINHFLDYATPHSNASLK